MSGMILLGLHLSHLRSPRFISKRIWVANSKGPTLSRLELSTFDLIDA